MSKKSKIVTVVLIVSIIAVFLYAIVTGDRDVRGLVPAVAAEPLAVPELLSGVGCPVLDDSSPGLEGGPWNDKHQFPRMWRAFFTHLYTQYTTGYLEGSQK